MYDGDEGLKFQPARFEDYLEFFTKFVKKGGKPDSFRDRPFYEGAGGMALAVADFRLNDECGAFSIDIIVPKGVRYLSGPSGHCSIYYQDTGTPEMREHFPSHVPLFDEPEMLALPGMRKFAETVRKRDRERRKEMEKENEEIEAMMRQGDVGRYLNVLRNIRS